MNDIIIDLENACNEELSDSMRDLIERTIDKIAHLHVKLLNTVEDIPSTNNGVPFKSQMEVWIYDKYNDEFSKGWFRCVVENWTETYVNVCDPADGLQQYCVFHSECYSNFQAAQKSQEDNNRTETKFETLKNNWLEETRFSSSTTDIVENKNYQQIIKMKLDALPYIFADLKKNPNHWNFALKQITDNDPAADCKGNIKEEQQKWLD